MARNVLIQIRRGVERDIGTLNNGELGYCTDTQKLYIGTDSGNVLLVAAQTVGDMLKSIYDTDNDGVVDAAESIPWNGVTGKPSTFPPSSHTHDDRYYTEDEIVDLLYGKQNKLNYTPVSKSGDTMTGGLYGLFPSTANTFVGNEYNLLLNANKRSGISITQTGTAKINTDMLFDGKVQPTYSNNGIPPNDPTVILISGLPNTHTQTGGAIGWTCRYWYPSKYKIEVYDAYNNKGWKTIIDQSSVDKPTKELLVPIHRGGFSGSFTSIKITIYESSVGEAGNNGYKRFGISEFFFIHQEAMKVYQYLDVDTIDGKHSSDFMPCGPITWGQLKGV